MKKQRITKDLMRHLLKLSGNDTRLAYERFKELLDILPPKNRMILSKLTKLPSRSYQELLHLAKRLCTLKSKTYTTWSPPDGSDSDAG